VRQALAIYPSRAIVVEIVLKIM